MAIQSDAERRRYFRVTDGVRLSYRVLAPETSAAAAAAGVTVPNHLELQLSEALAELRSDLPAVAHALDILNRKLEAMRPVLEAPQQAFEGTMLVSHAEVSLSACGIAFSGEQAVAPGERLLLGLTLMPESLHLEVTGEVVACEPLTENNGPEIQPRAEWLLRVEFKDVDESTLEQLIQHVMQRQLRDLKLRRLQQEESP